MSSAARLPDERFRGPSLGGLGDAHSHATARSVPARLDSCGQRSAILGRPGAAALAAPVEDRGIKVLDKRFVDRAKRAGLVVIVWTINDVDEMQRLLGIGVDGILTDNPTTRRPSGHCSTRVPPAEPGPTRPPRTTLSCPWTMPAAGASGDRGVAVSADSQPGR